MFNHVMLGAESIPDSKRFYDAALGALGVPPGEFDARGRVKYLAGGGSFMLTRPINGEAATGANGGTLGFSAERPEHVDASYAAGLAAGAAACEGSAGFREAPGIKVYVAHLRDPTGNKLCALHKIQG